MNELTESELDSLYEIARNDRLKMTIAEEHREKLLRLGYAELRHGGLIATGKGRLSLRAAGRPVN